MNDKIISSRRYWAVIAAVVVGVAVLVFYRPQVKHYMSDQGVVWTTDYHVTYEASHNMSDSIQRVFYLIDNSASVFNPHSLVSRINQNKTDRLDSCLMRMYRTALAVNKATGGAYDPTVMPLVNAWGFGYKRGQLPDKKMIDSLLHIVGIGKTRIEAGRLVKSDPRIQFDFSSIAKGLACDEVGRALERGGAASYMVEIGGEIACKGHNAKGEKWHVSIDMPIEDNARVEHQPALVIALDGGGVATSGNYRKYKEEAGKKVSHIVNPITGYSSESDLLSVTIVAPDCMTADAWATACMVMGTARTRQLMEGNRRLGVMTISADAQGNYVVWSNKRFASLVTSQQ